MYANGNAAPGAGDALDRHAAGDRVMLLTPDRLFYAGLLGSPSTRTMGSVMAYGAVEGKLRVAVGSRDWQVCELAVVPPYVPHQIISDCSLIHLIKVEAETVDVAGLPDFLRGSGAVECGWLVQRMRDAHRRLLEKPEVGQLSAAEFDRIFFDRPLRPRQLDHRIDRVVQIIKEDPSAPAKAEECASQVNLSFSRFLHLFRDEMGVPFRSFRTWKRARSFLHHVKGRDNLLQVALESGYPDSTHFSHSIRRVFGLTPKNIIAGSRRLVVREAAGPGGSIGP